MYYIVIPRMSIISLVIQNINKKTTLTDLHITYNKGTRSLKSNVIILWDSRYGYMISYSGLLVTLRHISLQNLSDLDFDLIRSPRVTCDGTVGLSVCDFLLVSNSNTWPNSVPFRDIKLWNRNDLDIDLSSLRKSNAIAPMDSPYILSYYCLIATLGLTLLLHEI